MQIWLCSIEIDFLFLCFYKIYTSNSCKMNDMSRGATRTFARGGNLLLCNGWGRGLKGGFPPFSKIFQKQKCFIRVLSRKKGNFKLLHADLAVFNSNQFFVLVFLQNLNFQQLQNEWYESIHWICVRMAKEYFLSTWFNYIKLNCKK